MKYPNAAFEKYQGLGMTSQRTRNRLIDRLDEKGIQDKAVLETMRIVPRHLFLDEAMSSRSYEDTALPIGYGQTISQPWVVAKMTEWLLAGDRSVKKVLEIGTGSGYQTAILALLIDQVYSVERIQPLSERAQQVITKLDLKNVKFSLSDGHWGWESKGPFDAIISAASPPELPKELLNQLKPGGRLVIPIGEETQVLYGYEKQASGVKRTSIAQVMFVPMVEGVKS